MRQRERGAMSSRWARGAAVGATVAALATGGWTVASADPLPLPQIPTPGHTYVTPDDLHNFKETDTRPPGTVEISPELEAPTGGNADALVLKTPDGNAKATFFTTDLAGPLSNFLSSSYVAKRDTSSTGAEFQFPSFQIPVDKNGGALETGDFSTLTFEPIYQTGANANTTSGSWNRYDTGIGLFCTTRQIGGFESNQTRCDNGGAKTLADIIAANPGITALSAGINQGSGNPGIIGGVDLLQVGTTTYNFEKKAPLPPVVPEPEDPDDPTCVPKPDDPGTGTPGDEHPGHPQPGDGHPGKDDHPGKDEHPSKDDHPGKDGGSWGEDPKSGHPGDGHPGGEPPKGDHPDGGEHPGGEHPGGGDHPDEPEIPTCET